MGSSQILDILTDRDTDILSDSLYEICRKKGLRINLSLSFHGLMRGTGAKGEVQGPSKESNWHPKAGTAKNYNSALKLGGKIK